MCKSCVQPVYTLMKSSGRVYNLCADFLPIRNALGISTHFSTLSTPSHAQGLSTTKIAISPLLFTRLSTPSTGPIIRTKKDIRSKLGVIQ